MHDCKRVMVWVETSGIYGRELLAGIAKYSRLHGPWTFYRRPPVYLNKLNITKLLKYIEDFKPQGIIVRLAEDIEALFDLNVPIVISPWNKDLIEPYPYIIGDCRQIARMAADHLLDKGFKQFAYCGFDRTLFSRRRCESFVEYLKSKGHETHVYSCSSRRKDNIWVKEIPGLSDWLNDLPKPIGLFACNDERAMNIVDTCFQANIKVPDQIAVVGVGNDDSICELANPPITSIKTDGEKAGYDAATLLNTLMMAGSEKMKSQRIIVEPMYVVTRMSTDVLAVDDTDVAKALSFIKRNAKKPISVDDVVDIVPLSRRLLEKKFRQILDRSILKEIKKERVKHIARLLVETNMSFSEIAYSVECSAIENLSRYFTKEMGMSPNCYRKQFTKYHRHPEHPLTYYPK